MEHYYFFGGQRIANSWAVMQDYSLNDSEPVVAAAAVVTIVFLVEPCIQANTFFKSLLQNVN